MFPANWSHSNVNILPKRYKSLAITFCPNSQIPTRMPLLFPFTETNGRRSHSLNQSTSHTACFALRLSLSQKFQEDSYVFCSLYPINCMESCPCLRFGGAIRLACTSGIWSSDVQVQYIRAIYDCDGFLTSWRTALDSVEYVLMLWCYSVPMLHYTHWLLCREALALQRLSTQCSGDKLLTLQARSHTSIAYEIRRKATCEYPGL